MIKTQHCPNCEATEQKLHDYKQKVSDALLEGDAQTILYLLGVRHGREDERAKIAAEASKPTQGDDEAYDLGKRDGYEKAVQDIDMLTGGDGEYCYSTIEGERHCPNVDTMKARIARRLRQPTQSDALREAEILEAAIDRMGWVEINAYRAELRKGQGAFEDAGGFMIRAVKALFGIKPIDPVVNYQSAARALVTAALQEQSKCP